MNDRRIDRGASVTIRGLTKSYENGRIEALRGIDLEIAAGEFLAIMGPSGCGKSTMLNIVGGLDVADGGSVEIAGEALTSQTDLTDYRARTIGFIFQLHNLIPVLTAVENVQVPMLSPGGIPKAERAERALDLIDAVGLSHRESARPPELSGGERQRVAVARALANRPGIILADEPTGSLDQESGKLILDLLARIQEESGTTLILVTHDENVAARAGRVIRMLDGQVVSGEA
ncbi:MAG: ABC transporter ATP-binding protein [Planctomycetota bacterium]